MLKFDFSYDLENDDLFVYRKDTKSKGAVEIGNLVVDFDYKGEIVAIEVMDASKFISYLANKSVNMLLKTLKSCKVDVRKEGNAATVKLFLRNNQQEVPVNVSIPAIMKQSSAVRY